MSLPKFTREDIGKVIWPGACPIGIREALKAMDDLRVPRRFDALTLVSMFLKRIPGDTRNGVYPSTLMTKRSRVCWSEVVRAVCCMVPVDVGIQIAANASGGAVWDLPAQDRDSFTGRMLWLTQPHRIKPKTLLGILRRARRSR